MRRPSKRGSFPGSLSPAHLPFSFFPPFPPHAPRLIVLECVGAHARTRPPSRAELGRATWKFLHVMMARYPETPTQDDQIALRNFIHLFGRLYPCGQCADHFRMMLQKYPPQTSSRNAAAGWACFVHNIVNEKLHKDQFDCSKIGDFYDCGCGDDKKEAEPNVDLTEHA